GEAGYDRTELTNPLVAESRRRSCERDRAERLLVLVVDRRRDAARAGQVLLVVERPAALANDTDACPHRLRRRDRVLGDARQTLDLQQRVDLVVGQRREDRLAHAGSVQRHAAAELDDRTHRLTALDLVDEYRFGAVV